MVAFYTLKNRPIYRLNIGEENYILRNLRKIRDGYHWIRKAPLPNVSIKHLENFNSTLNMSLSLYRNLSYTYCTSTSGLLETIPLQAILKKAEPINKNLIPLTIPTFVRLAGFYSKDNLSFRKRENIKKNRQSLV